MIESYYTDARHELLPHLPVELGDVLELGCAAGAHGALLLASGRARSVVGIDRFVPTDDAASRLTRFERADVVEWVAISTERFDTILALDVLEHLEDPWSVVAASSRLLRPGGRFVASIPNVRFASVLVDLVVRGRFDYHDAGVLDRTHLRFFTRRSIVALFEDGGFQVDAVRRLRNSGRRRTARVAITALRDFGCKQFVVLAHPAAA